MNKLKSSKENLFSPTEKSKNFNIKFESKIRETEEKQDDDINNISHYSQIQRSSLKDDHKVELVKTLDKIKEVEEKFNTILDKHQMDYLKSFNEFMDSAKKDITKKINDMERVQRERRKNENIKIIVAEREFFRSEAIRLNKICKEMNSKLEESKREIDNKENDIIILKKKMSDSELINKQLTQELKRNAIYITELENQIKFIENKVDPLDGEIPTNQFELKQNASQHGKITKIENIDTLDEKTDYNIDKFESLQNIIDNLRGQLKKEKAKNSRILGEVNKIMIDKNKLEKIFIDCVEESRKEIIMRKNKENLHKTKNDLNKMPLLNSQQNNEVKFENFLNTDKKRIIENFLLREDVINFLHENLFSKVGDFATEKDFATTRSTFVKTADSKIRSTFYTNAKKTPTTGFSYNLPSTMQGRAKTPNINILF